MLKPESDTTECRDSLHLSTGLKPSVRCHSHIYMLPGEFVPTHSDTPRCSSDWIYAVPNLGGDHLRRNPSHEIYRSISNFGEFTWMLSAVSHPTDGS